MTLRLPDACAIGSIRDGDIETDDFKDWPGIKPNIQGEVVWFDIHMSDVKLCMKEIDSM
jgi:hypothetical protein